MPDVTCPITSRFQPLTVTAPRVAPTPARAGETPGKAASAPVGGRTGARPADDAAAVVDSDLHLGMDFAPKLSFRPFYRDGEAGQRHLDTGGDRDRLLTYA